MDYQAYKDTHLCAFTEYPFDCNYEGERSTPTCDQTLGYPDF